MEKKYHLEDIHLGGMAFIRHLKEHHPEMYWALKKAGKLEQVAYISNNRRRRF